jgi:hypothetical protein
MFIAFVVVVAAYTNNSDRQAGDKDFSVFHCLDFYFWIALVDGERVS